MKLGFIISFIFFAFHLSFSQTYTLVGKITDINGSELPYAKITNKLNQQSSLSSIKGNYQIQSTQNKMDIHITYIGYESIDTIINFKDGTNLISFDFKLKPSNQQLNTVVITTAPYEQVYETYNLNILDYTFFGSNIILLVKSKEGYQIRLVDPFEKVLTKQNLNFHPISFTRDCLGFIYVMADDYMFQLEFDSEKFIFSDPISVEDYFYFRAPCVASSETHFYLKHISDFNQKITYISQHRYTNEYQTLRIIGDSGKIADVNNYAEKINAMADVPMTMELDQVTLRMGREKFQEKSFFHHVVSVEYYSPLLKSNQTIFIFDHASDSCLVFSTDGIYERSFHIQYHYRNDWVKKIITDERQEKIYILFQLNGIYSISELNQLDGTFNSVKVLEEHTFPEKIKVRDGYVYYLHHPLTDTGYDKLYRVRLDN